jgi:hypothetical protein
MLIHSFVRFIQKEYHTPHWHGVAGEEHSQSVGKQQGVDMPVAGDAAWHVIR